MDAVQGLASGAAAWLAAATSVPPPISPAATEMLLVAAVTLFACAAIAVLHPGWATAMDRSRNVSTVHSVIVVFWAVACYREVSALLFEPSGAAWLHSSVLIRMPIAITIGYIAFDSLLGLAFPNLLDPLMMVHHAVVLTSYCTSLYSGCGNVYCALFLINEASTVPLNFHYQFCGRAGGLPRLLNGAALWLLYLTCRMLANAFFTWSIFVTSAPAVRAAYPLTWGLYMAVLATLWALNTNWFYRITLGFVKALSTGGGPSKKKQPAAAAAVLDGGAPSPAVRPGAASGAGALGAASASAASSGGDGAAQEPEDERAASPLARGGPTGPTRQRRVQRGHA